jgi:LuxR family maltose regulon positive regulatory protein
LRILQSQYYFQLGLPTRALQTIEKKEPTGQIQFDLTSRVEIYLRTAIQIAIAKKQNNTDQIHKALATCEELLSGLSGRPEGYLRLQTLVQKVIALAALENFDQALESFEEALTLAEPEGFVRVFFDLGVYLPGLIQRISIDSPIYDYAQNIQAAYQAQIKQYPQAHPGKQPEFANNQDLVEPLSAREIEILRLVADGLSNQEIATRLVLAPGTVKRHLHNIFGKLDVTTRSQAIAYARKKNFS